MLHDINSNFFLLIYILLWLVTCYKYYHKVKITTGFIIIVSYLFYGVLAFFLYNDKYYGSDYSSLELLPFIYLYAMLYIFLIPVYKYEKSDIMFVSIPNNKIVKIFLLFYAISSLVVLPNTIASLKEGLVILLLDSAGGTDLYRMAQENYTVRTSGVSGLYGLFAIIHNSCSDIAIFMAFYYLTIKNKNRYLLLILIVVFISDFLYPLSKGSRTDVVMKFFSLIVAISLFFPYYSERLRVRVKKLLIFFLMIISIPFMALTISRFSFREGGTMGGMLAYIAQSPLNFNINALDNGGIRYGDRTFNLFKQILGMNPPNDIGEVRTKYYQLNMDDSIFSTFIGDFVLDFGPIGAIVILALLSFFCYKLIKISQKTTSFHSLLIVYFVACVAMHGGMYLFNYSFMGNLTILAFMFTYFVFYWNSYNRKHKQLLQKNNIWRAPIK